MTFVMLFSFSSTVLAAKTDIASTEYYTLSYDSESGVPKIVLTLDADKLGQFVQDRNLSKDELKKFLPDIFANALANRTLPSIQEILAFFPTDVLSYDEITKIIPADILSTLIDVDMVERLVPKSEWDNILPLGDVVDANTIDTLVTDYPAVLDALLTDTVLDTLLTGTAVTNLVDSTVVKSLIATKEDARVFVDKGVIDQADIENILSSGEKTEVAAAADPTAKAIELALANHEDDLAALLTANASGVVDAIGYDKLISVVGLDNIVAEVGVSNIISAVGTENIVDAVLKNCDAGFVQSLLQKALNSSNFSLKTLLNAIDRTALKTELQNMLTEVFLNRVDAIKFVSSTNGTTNTTTVLECIETASSFERKIYFNKMLEAVALSIPTVDTLSDVQNGDAIYDFAFQIVFNNTTEVAGFGVEFKVEGDTSVLNAYADKIFEIVDYKIDLGNKVTVNVDDTASTSRLKFAKLFTKILETDRFSDARKAEIFSVFNKTGDDLIDALKAFDLSKIADIAAEVGVSVDELDKLRDKCVTILEKAMAKAPEKYATLSFATIYNSGVFSLSDSAEVNVDRLIDKVSSVLGISPALFKNNFVYDSVSASYDLSIKMKDVYRVRYYGEDGALLYTTFLPVGTKLAVINDNTSEIIGKAPNGWMDENAVVVTEVPANDIDLYASEVHKTYYATFVADGRIIDVVPFKEGDIVLSRVPAVPTKEYHDAKWEAYTLGNTDITINAVYTIRTHIATFIADGKIVAKVEFNEGSVQIANPPRVPNKVGYHGRWQQYVLGTEDITIRAIYTNKAYHVIFNANGGEGKMADQLLAYDVSANLSANRFTREGYTFTGWNTKADGTGFTYVDKALVKNLTKLSGITLYAQWEEVPPTIYTVTFMANGVVVDKVTYEAGATKLDRVPGVPARDGYTGTWDNYVLNDSDITVNATYTANKYTIVFNANGGSGSMANQEMTYEVFADLTKNAFTKDGYTFAGWNTAADGSGVSYKDGENVKNVTGEGEVILYAQWDEVETTETTTQAPEATPAPPVEEDGFNWVLFVIIVAVLAVVGGVVGFLVYKKRKG